MTKARLRLNVFLVIAVFALLPATGLACRFYFHVDAIYRSITDFASLVIATGAAYLAYCFQRRQVFLVALRELWRELIYAKTELIDFTHFSAPDQVAYAKAHRAISVAIDMVRGVYRNVGESETAIGYYPFEPIHDMRRALETLGWHETTPEAACIARRSIIASWNALRWAFLKEFSTPEPRHPIVDRNATDPRRHRSGTSKAGQR